MPKKGAVDTVLILGRLQETYYARGKALYVCFVDLEKAVGRVACIVLKLSMRKRGIPEVLFGSVMNPYEDAK